MSRQRIGWIDIAKGIGIIAMVMGHIDFGAYVRYFIHAWNMPLFFILSGYLYRDEKKNFRYHIGKKAKSLLVPYFSFAFIHFIIWIVKYQPDIETIQQTLSSIFWINTNNGLPIANALWFLPCMFFATILFDCIHRMCGSKLIKESICVVIIVCVGIFMPSYTYIEFPWALFQAFVAVGFIYIGVLLKKYDVIDKISVLCIRQFSILTIFSTIFSGLMIMLHQEVNMRTSSYGCFFMFIINATLFPVLIFAVSERLTRSQKRIVNIIIEEIKFVGKNSIVYLCLNQITIFAVGMVLDFTNHLIFKLVCLFACMILLHIFSLIIMGNPFNFLVGKIPDRKG